MIFFKPYKRKILINKGLVIQKQVKNNADRDERHFGVILTPFSSFNFIYTNHQPEKCFVSLSAIILNLKMASKMTPKRRSFLSALFLLVSHGNFQGVIITPLVGLI